ncbi:MAG: MMPL family transporter [Actinomycetota bacterium]|nr:MMPL family transporter [Actinomycetota bacterium]
MFSTLGSNIYRHRRVVLGGWLVVLVAGATLGPRVVGRLDTDMQGDARLESSRVAARLETLGSAGEEVVAVVEGRPADVARQAQVADAARDVRAMPGVVSVADASSNPSPALVASDGGATLVVATIAPGLGQAAEQRLVDAVERRLRQVGPGVTVGGSALLDEEFRRAAERDLRRGEAIALPLAFAIMVVLLGGLVVAGLPLAVAVVAVAGAFLVLLAATAVTDVSTFAINVVVSLGIGLAIDYGLLLVNRYREERGGGRDVPAAVERTVATAGMTVVFSGLTLAVAQTGLFAFGDPLLSSFAVAGIGVVLFAMAAGVTLLPALLAVVGRRIPPARPAPDHGYFFRLSRLVQSRAGLVTAGVTVVLASLAVPFLHARFEVADSRSLPRSSESRALAMVLAERFPTQGADPIVVVADVDARSPALASYVSELRRLSGVAAVSVRSSPADPVSVVEVVPLGTSQGHVAQELVRTLRARDPGFRAEVGGTAAFLVDFTSSVADRLPLAAGVLVVATLSLLFLMTGSLAVPLKAIVMGLLSLGASFGALVLVFQDGHLAGLLGFDPVGSLDIFGPLMIFIFAFGLSMDYEVFLLGRIKEVHEEIGDNDAAVAVGLQRTGRIVTSAALLIVVVFAGFATGETLIVKQFGLGMALAVLVDATIVRSLLVPATMKLLGEWNWWAPAPLQRLHRRLGLFETTAGGPLREQHGVPALTGNR